jgi:hypothetical protein
MIGRGNHGKGRRGIVLFMKKASTEGGAEHDEAVVGGDRQGAATGGSPSEGWVPAP